MKLRYKILGGLVILLGVGVVSLALVMSHTTACGPAPSPPAGATLMKGIAHRCYGPPEVLRYEDIAKPIPADNEILVKVHAASVNPLDWHYLEGKPYLVRMDQGFGKPASPRLGVDFAGTVEAVGGKVTRFKPGDEVFGGKFGAFAPGPFERCLDLPLRASERSSDSCHGSTVARSCVLSTNLPRVACGVS